ncbi:hypothetical protein OPT61_g7282 [Boeremia exigua]|uniref:Uncharacterized protein n=1 Tax=Boeremia exigua TaxID=749465 RepID=A0ACC2I2U2_9PLEO|nr:hypothetical protein OPT61_g7282 [Boeremia exigua]
MGGHAFKSLHCPRIPPDVYTEVKSIATAALGTVFTHVTVPFEIPGKADYGDCDFLASAPFGHSEDLTIDTFPFESVVEAVKRALGTPHGRRGFLTPTCMYFAVPSPSKLSTCSSSDGEASDEETASWVQIDVKICLKPGDFSWMAFETNYASQSSILGSMIKPLGLTLDCEGLHIRVEETESTNWAGSMVWITQDPWMACRVLVLGRKAVDGAFQSTEEIYRESAGSWLFHPETFKAKLEDESYLVQHTHRSYFLKSWIPALYPDHKLPDKKDEGLEVWTARTRAAVREKVFTMCPPVAEKYYIKRSLRLREVEECKLRDLITAAIPTGTNGWQDDFNLPPVITHQPHFNTAS